MTEQAAERIFESELGSHANAAEKAGADPAESDKVIAAVGTRAKNRVRHSQFPKRQAQQGGGKRGRIRTDDYGLRVGPQKPRKGAPQPLTKVAALLPPATESGGNHPLRQASARGKHVTRHIAFEPGDFAKRVPHERPVKLCGSIRPQRGDQPGLGSTGNNRT